MDTSGPRDQNDTSELYEHHRFIVDKRQELLRVDKYLLQKIENVSRTKIQAAAQAGCILANNDPVKPSYKVKPGDVITVRDKSKKLDVVHNSLRRTKDNVYSWLSVAQFEFQVKAARAVQCGTRTQPHPAK